MSHPLRCFHFLKTFFKLCIFFLSTQQDINYMSLMEVLAASFSNLQLTQQQQQQQHQQQQHLTQQQHFVQPQQSPLLAQSNINYSHPNESTLTPAAGVFYPPPAQRNMSLGGAHGSGSTNPLLRCIPALTGRSAGKSGVNQVKLSQIKCCLCDEKLWTKFKA